MKQLQHHERRANWAGAGALIAAGGLLGSRLWLTQRFPGPHISGSLVPGSGFFQVSSSWWSRSDAISLLAVSLFAVCGIVLLTKPQAWATALVMAPAAMLGIPLALGARTAPGAGFDQLAMGFWCELVCVAGCAISTVMGTRWLMTGPWKQRGARQTTLPATAVACIGIALALAAAFTPRASDPRGGGALDPSIWTRYNTGWDWAAVAGIVGVFVLVPLAAIWLGRARRTASLAFGTAFAVVVWDRGVVSVFVLRARLPMASRPHPLAGFWFLMASVATFIALGVLLRQKQAAATTPHPTYCTTGSAVSG